METVINCVHGFAGGKVLTVPMRNGNGSLSKFAFAYLHRSYRTYEEWKRSTSLNETEK